ncbi:MAG TPA: arginine--tRNA ligase [Patescibacteria group bacterium]
MKNTIQEIIKNALFEAKKANNWPAFEIAEIIVDHPKNDAFGDYTTNVAMILSKQLKKNPLEIANELKVESEKLKDSYIEKIEIAPPGHINFYLSRKYLQDVVEKINSEKEKFGSNEIGSGVKINNEFISANPTGPMHLGNGRGGFFGDSLSRVLRKAGFEVANEYYVNDAGEQVMKLGHSVLKDEEAVYGGEYIDKLNAEMADGKDVREVGEKAAEYILENFIKKTAAEKMQISFDEWISEKSLCDEGFVDRAIEILSKKGLTFEEEGALWLRTTDFGDDKDRVLVKANGQKTYFASDCGYILNKVERGFTDLVETWGADHHGYIVRFSAAAQALGVAPERVRFNIVQLVRLMKDGKEVRMSKRAGNVVYIDDLIDELGHDVTRFFFLMYSPDTHMNFDMGLAAERSQKNPVFYVQYAHARISSILEKAREAGISNFQFPISKQDVDLSLLQHERELNLIKELDKFPELVAEVSETYAVHKLPHYAISLADKFHSFYDACRVIDEENPELTKARLSLVEAARIVLAETLRLVGVDAPEKM